MARYSAVEAALFLIPVCFVPMMRAKFISIYAEEPSDNTDSNLSTNLLANDDNV